VRRGRLSGCLGSNNGRPERWALAVDNFRLAGTLTTLSRRAKKRADKAEMSLPPDELCTTNQ